MLITHILARNARVEADLVDQLFNSTVNQAVLGRKATGAGSQ